MRYFLRRTLLQTVVLIAALGIRPSAIYAGDPLPKELARYDALIKSADRKHWGFQPVQRPAVSVVKNGDWVRNPIDAFVLARMEAQGWRPAPTVEPRALLRRIFLDLTGIPPTLAEQASFLKNPSAEAVDRLVQDLLSRRGYGA